MKKVITLDIKQLNDDWLSGDPARCDRALRSLAYALFHCAPEARQEIEEQLLEHIDPRLFEVAKATANDRGYRHIDTIISRSVWYKRGFS